MVEAVLETLSGSENLNWPLKGELNRKLGEYAYFLLFTYFYFSCHV